MRSLIWLAALAIGAGIGGSAGGVGGAIGGAIIAHIIVAISTKGPKYPGDTNY